MSARRCVPRRGMVPPVALLLSASWAVAALAQVAPAPTSGNAAMEGAMPGMSMPAPAASAPRHAPSHAGRPAGASVQAPRRGPARMHPVPASAAPEAMPAMDQASKQGMDHGSMQGMDEGSMRGMGHDAMQGTNHGAARGTGHASMQGIAHGKPVPGGRDPDYSAGTTYRPTHGVDMAMDDNARIGMLLADQLEAFHGAHGDGQQWDIQGHYGNDYDKLWLRTEGERSDGQRADASVEALWNHAVAPFWGTQLGVRTDLGEGPGRAWAALGIQGMAPYWFELEATGYVGPSGRTAARFRAQYELLFTQRLVLQPELEANAYARADPSRRLGSGVSDASLGLRLRYEFGRQFAPYVGVLWTRRFGRTARFARAEGQGSFDRQWVAGLRVWF